MNEVSNELLAQLRDIHSANAPGWWPPAPGWWLLAAILCGLLFLLIRFLYRRWSVAKRRARYLRALEHIESTVDPGVDPHEYLAQLNRLFRAVALRAFPGTASTRLQGSAWVGFLRSLLPDGKESESLSALEIGPYQPKPEFDVAGLNSMAREWVKRYG